MVLNSRIFGELTFFSTARWRVSCLRCCGETATNLKIWREISYRFGEIFTNLKAVGEHQVQLCSLDRQEFHVVFYAAAISYITAVISCYRKIMKPFAAEFLSCVQFSIEFYDFNNCIII